MELTSRGFLESYKPAFIVQGPICLIMFDEKTRAKLNVPHDCLKDVDAIRGKIHMFEAKHGFRETLISRPDGYVGPCFLNIFD